MNQFLTLKPEAFGLDISDLSLKIVKLKKKKNFLSLACFGETFIKPGIIEQGIIKDKKRLSEAIRDALDKVKGEKLKTKYVIASLPEEKAFLQVIQMPKMGQEELRKAVRFEAENYVPLPLDKVYLGFQVVPPVQNHLDHLDVLIAAFPRKSVDAYLSVIQEAGLKPLALEIESQAICRALIKDGLSVEPLLLVDLGAVRTSLIIFSGYSLRFTSSLPVSSRNFTQAISQVLKVDFKKAEKLKLKYGLNFGRENSAKIEKDVFEAIIPALTDLLEQIKKSLIYYQTHASHEHLPPDGKKIKKIFLCGGGANLKNLSCFLSQELGVSVSRANPWVNILPDPIKEVPELSYDESLKYTTALGLALRGVNS